MKNPPLNRCIYCLRRPGDPKTKEDISKNATLAVGAILTLNDFSREHIFPEGLGGTFVLGKASCPACRKITGDQIELFCIRRMLWAMRSLTGHKSGVKLPDTDTLAVLPVFPPPTIFQGMSEPQHETIRMNVLSANLASVRSQANETLPSSYDFNNPLFSRFLAKVAHGLCVRRYGLEGFEPFLPDVILGKQADYWTFVGGSEVHLPSRGNHIFQIGHISIPGYPDDIFIQVLMTLFANFRGAELPTYQIIAGRLLKQVSV